MTSERDFERLLDHWLAEGPAEVNDRVIESVADRIGRQPQRPAWRVSWEEMHMNTYLKPALAAAAVVIVAVAGIAYVGRPAAGPGGVATPSPSVSPSISPEPTPRGMFDGELPAGSYVTHPFSAPDSGLRITYTVPAGWTGFGDWALLGPNGTGAPAGVGIGFLMATGLFSDGCHWDQLGNGTWPQVGDITVGPSVDDLVAALRVHPDYEVSAPTDAVVSGYPAKRLDLAFPTDVDLTSCDNAAGATGGAYFVWGTSNSNVNDLYAQGPGQIFRLWIVDVDGARVIIVSPDYATTSAADRAAAQSIIDSVVIGP